MTNKSYEEYLRGTAQILAFSQAEKAPYDIEVLGKVITIFQGVFSPKYFKDSVIFAERFPILKGETVLEIGPGTGILSVFACYRGARTVVAVDINPSAVKNTRYNLKQHGFDHKATVLQGDLYQPLPPACYKFDTIMWNVPFGFISERTLSMLERATVDPQYRSLQSFISNAKSHLTHNGRLLIGFSSTLGKLDLLEQFCHEASFSLALLHEEESTEVHPIKFEVFEARPKS